MRHRNKIKKVENICPEGIVKIITCWRQKEVQGRGDLIKCIGKAVSKVQLSLNDHKPFTQRTQDLGTGSGSRKSSEMQNSRSRQGQIPLKKRHQKTKASWKVKNRPVESQYFSPRKKPPLTSNCIKNSEQMWAWKICIVTMPKTGH